MNPRAGQRTRTRQRQRLEVIAYAQLNMAHPDINTFSLCYATKTTFDVLTQPPKRLHISDFVFTTNNIHKVLHEGLVVLCLAYRNRFARFRMSRGITRQIVVTQLINLQKLRELAVASPETFCKPLNFVHRSSLEMSLVKLHLYDIRSPTAVTLKFVKAVSRAVVLKDVFLCFARGTSLRLTRHQVYYLICAYKLIPNLSIGASCSLTMQAAALHRLLRRADANEGMFEMLTLKGVGNNLKGEKVYEKAWRSIFGEVGRGGVGRLRPTCLGLEHELISGSIEVLHYLREPFVLGSVVLELESIVRYRQDNFGWGSGRSRIEKYIVE